MRKAIRAIDTWRRTAEAIPPDCPIAAKARKRRHSKRQDFRGLPSDWKEQLLSRLPKYRLIYLAAAVTGCRPGELLKGVRVVVADRQLVCYIEGAKVTKFKGQAFREMRFHFGNPLVDALRDEALHHGADLMIKLATANGARLFSNAMASAGARLWPSRKTRVTPYMLRHQLAGDLKAAGRDVEQIAQILGHAVTDTQTIYGHHKTGRGGVLPTSVTAARIPRDTRSKKTIPVRKPKTATKSIAISVKSRRPG